MPMMSWRIVRGLNTGTNTRALTAKRNTKTTTCGNNTERQCDTTVQVPLLLRYKCTDLPIPIRALVVGAAEITTRSRSGANCDYKSAAHWDLQETQMPALGTRAFAARGIGQLLSMGPETSQHETWHANWEQKNSKIGQTDIRLVLR